MQQTIISKIRFLGKTIGYVGWSLFWLLIWDVIVTVDFMLYLERKITLPSMPLTLLGSALVVLTSFRNSSAYNRGGKHERCGARWSIVRAASLGRC
ncbi:putative membrane protein [Pseudomonas amygdali pv. tabaci]|uniref:Putative membrane protein n=1 Tax=Pseudomonas amygdali pv. tabaci TaxID=322 RepID=A0A3M6G922_PSEAJ|nr:putative membrane protein [Pseudomonas amygdali pv. tabaci]